MILNTQKLLNSEKVVADSLVTRGYVISVLLHYVVTKVNKMIVRSWHVLEMARIEFRDSWASVCDLPDQRMQGLLDDKCVE